MSLQRFSRRLTCFLLLFLFPFCVVGKPLEIIFWHSMAGQLGEEVNALTTEFNNRQKDFKVVPVYKGDYIESLTSFAAAFRAKQPPNIIQVFEVGTPIMLNPKGIIKPTDVLMTEQGLQFSKDSFFTAVRNSYSEHQQLMAMPFNVSIPIMFYNADALKSLGVLPSAFPRTWNDLEVLVMRLKKAGFQCGYTTAYPAWILIESYSALNGLSSTDLASSNHRNNALTEHIKRLRRWQLKHYFEYGGRVDDATLLFTSGRCPLFSQSSGAYNSLDQMVPFNLGVAPLPIDSSLSDVRHNNVVGGAAIWVVSGQSSEKEKGIAQFLAFLADPNRQSSWYKNTGYLPLLGKTNSSLNNQWPTTILDIAALDLNQKDNLAEGGHQAPKNQIRNINDEMLEAIFSGILSPEEGVNKASSRERHATSRFKKIRNKTGFTQRIGCKFT